MLTENKTFPVGTWIHRSDLKVGDITLKYINYNGLTARLKVVKVTATQLTLEDGSRWMIKSGKQIGVKDKDSALSDWTRQETEEELTAKVEEVEDTAEIAVSDDESDRPPENDQVFIGIAKLSRASYCLMQFKTVVLNTLLTKILIFSADLEISKLEGVYFYRKIEPYQSNENKWYQLHHRFYKQLSSTEIKFQYSLFIDCLFDYDTSIAGKQLLAKGFKHLNNTLPKLRLTALKLWLAWLKIQIKYLLTDRDATYSIEQHKQIQDRSLIDTNLVSTSIYLDRFEVYALIGKNPANLMRGIEI